MFAFGYKQCVDPDSLYTEFAEQELPTELFAGKANSFTVRAGATPSGGFVLMRQADLDALPVSAAYTLQITDHLNHTIPFVNLWMVSRVRVVGGEDGDPTGIQLVELADNRRRLNMVPISKAYNIRPADGSSFYNATRNGGSDWTWTTLATDLWTTVGGLGSWPGFPSTLVLPAAVPENFNFYGSYALPALVSVLNRLGAELRHDNTTDTYSIVRIGDGTDSTYYQSWASADRKFDGRATTPDAANRPEKIRVRFRRFPAPTTGADPYYTVDVALSTSTGVLTGSVIIVDDDMAALNATGAPSNASSLATRAAERAADWERRYTKMATAAVVQYREYLAAARLAVGERRDAAVFEDVGDGYTTESFSVTSPLFEKLRFYADTTQATSPPGTLTTKNADGTAIDATTTTIITDQATGLQTAGTAGTSTFSLRNAGTAQRGVIGITADALQKMSGRKVFVDTQTILGVSVDSGVIDTLGGGGFAGTFYADTNRANTAAGAYMAANTIAVNTIAVNSHDTIVTPSVTVGSAGGSLRGQVSSSTILAGELLVGANDAAGNFPQALLYAYVVSGVYTSGLSFTGGATPLSVGFFYDYAATNLKIQSVCDVTYAAGVGPVVRSPNGNRWRLTVSNAGVVGATGPL